jgi:secreted PhoX family phosphatase
MSLRRRQLLALLGLGVGSVVAPGLGRSAPAGSARSGLPLSSAPLPFEPVLAPLPLASDGLAASEQRRRYGRLALKDRVVVPEGFRADLLLAWGDPLGSGRVGFNNDFLALTPQGPERALLTINFEYISERPWLEGFAEVVGQPLPWSELVTALKDRGGRIDCTALSPSDPLWPLLRGVADQAMADLGIGVATLVASPAGGWVRSAGPLDRRITGISGLSRPEQRLKVSGPAATVFRRRQRLGYDDGLGDRVIGTFANCAGGTTPWGTVLSAEENFQSLVCEPVFADGSSQHPRERPLICRQGDMEGLGNVYGLAGNKYGWMVEIDPADPNDPGTKHTALGRFRHEAVAVKAVAGAPLVVYSGDDRRGGHLYRFVSAGVVLDPLDTRNSALFGQGRLEVARFSADGSGRWIPLLPSTPLDPFMPSGFGAAGLPVPVMLPNPDRLLAGGVTFTADAEVQAYAQRFPTLAALYPGSGEVQLGAILIDAHLAGNAVGATPTARPEDTDLDPVTGDLLIAFTSGSPDAEGGADPAMFQGPKGETSWPHGFVMRLSEAGPAAEGRFRWRMVATGGEPWAGGLGFTNPDNLALDRAGNLWMVTDRSMGSSAADLFGNNSCWLLPRQGAAAGEALCFATGPMECELCGLALDPQERSLLLAVQHPGEANGTHRAGMEEFQAFTMVDREGVRFSQLRQVPLGSNWPAGAPGRPPRPGVVVIRRLDGSALLKA